MYFSSVLWISAILIKMQHVMGLPSEINKSHLFFHLPGRLLSTTAYLTYVPHMGLPQSLGIKAPLHFHGSSWPLNHMVCEHIKQYTTQQEYSPKPQGSQHSHSSSPWRKAYCLFWTIQLNSTDSITVVTSTLDNICL